MAASTTRTGLTPYWVAEAVRLHEIRTGPLDDHHEVSQALKLQTSFSDRLLERATQLGEREGWFTAVRRWHQLARFSALLLMLIAAGGGATVAFGILGPAERQINVLLALVTVLGLPTLTLLFWLISLIMPGTQRRGSMGEIWLWLNERFGRQSHRLDISRALVSLLSRHRILQPLLGVVSHGFWLVALLSTTLTLAGLLSARRYTFNWETTLLSPDAFVWLVSVLGRPLSAWGLDGPEPAMIRLSDGLHALPDAVHLQWSAWLIGCIFFYGIVPRLMALAVTVFLTWHRLARLSLDPELPGHAELRSRLDPISLPGSIDAPAPQHIPIPDQAPGKLVNTAGAALIGIELPSEYDWPPNLATPSASVRDLGIVDHREQRQQALAQLRSAPPERLLIACDSAQTPDRGTIMLIQQLASLAHTTHIMLLVPDAHGTTGVADRVPVWHASLDAAGITHDRIHTDAPSALTWLRALP